MATIYLQDLVEEFCALEEHRERLLYVEETDSLYLYQEEAGYYKLLSDRQLERLAYRFLRVKPKGLSQGIIKDFLYQVGLMCYIQKDRLSNTHIALKDQLLNLKTFETEPHRPSSFAHHHLPFAHTDLSMPTPLFNKFLSEILVTEEGQTSDFLATVVQEMFGFYILEEIKPEAVFFLSGTGANGKSVLLDILHSLIGDEQVSHISIESLTTNRFAASGLIGMKLNLCQEEESKHLRSDKFKTLVSGQPIQVERKYGRSFQMRPSTKYVFSSNSIPSFDGVDPAITRRVKIIPCHRRFADKDQDKGLFEKLRAELPGILGWAIEGAKRLKMNNYVFSSSPEMDAAREQFENDTSSAVSFIREKYHYDEVTFIANDELYGIYNSWCLQNGRKPMNSNNFNKDITHICGKSVIKWSQIEQRSIRGRTLKLIGSG